MTEPSEFCAVMDEWARIKSAADEDFGSRWERIRSLDIGKSCLLDRMLYHGEKPSETPCPVHKGRWAGLHQWGSREIDGKFHVVWFGVDGERVGKAEDDMLAEWRAAGCRCWQHKCGCTTGWQPEAAEAKGAA